MSVGLAAQTLLVAGSASASSGGGCSGTQASTWGWSFNSCISAAGGYLRPDGYVVAVGNVGTSCVVAVDLIRNGSVVATEYNQCVTGHVTGNWGINESGSYFTAVYAILNGNQSTAEVISSVEKN